ncbi:hypothetical protein Ciccas_010875 [Cichlidogyrus casuarinus]|uniref:Uncharacterized protein n=1 Tax=Cichlidogyrus casuarinus TaxID=1844966 RepID=A0ABD2PU11_9PLAT
MPLNASITEFTDNISLHEERQTARPLNGNSGLLLDCQHFKTHKEATFTRSSCSNKKHISEKLDSAIKDLERSISEQFSSSACTSQQQQPDSCGCIGNIRFTLDQLRSSSHESGPLTQTASNKEPNTKGIHRCSNKGPFTPTHTQSFVQVFSCVSLPPDYDSVFYEVENCVFDLEKRPDLASFLQFCQLVYDWLSLDRMHVVLIHSYGALGRLRSLLLLLALSSFHATLKT